MTRLAGRMRKLREATGASTSTGWMYDEVCWLLFGMIRFYKPSLVIQTGHLWGKSALVACEALASGELNGDRMGDPTYSDFVAHNRPAQVEGRLISIDPEPLGVPNSEAGVELLTKWYPSFQFLGTTSREFFENFSVAPEERIFGIVDGDHTRAGARGDLHSLAALGAETILLDDTSWIPELEKVGNELEGYVGIQFPEYNGVMLLTRMR